MTTALIPFNELQKQMFTALNGNISAAVYDNVPENVTKPWVTIGEATGIPDNWHGGFGWDITVTVHAGGQSAYARARYTLKAKMGDRDIDSEGLATYVLLKGSDGTWQIRHAHTSGRARRPAAQ